MLTTIITISAANTTGSDRVRQLAAANRASSSSSKSDIIDRAKTTVQQIGTTVQKTGIQLKNKVEDVFTQGKRLAEDQYNKMTGEKQGLLDKASTKLSRSAQDAKTSLSRRAATW